MYQSNFQTSKNVCDSISCFCAILLVLSSALCLPAASQERAHGKGLNIDSGGPTSMCDVTRDALKLEVATDK